MGFPRRRRPRCIAPCGGVVGLRVAGRRGELFLTCRIRLPRRNMGSRRRVRAADGLRHPRGLGGAAEAHEPGEKMGAKLLKRRQGFVGEGRLCVHAAEHTVARLTDGSDETASTPKIVSDARSAVRLEDEVRALACSATIKGKAARKRRSKARSRGAIAAGAQMARALKTMRPRCGGLIARASRPAALHQAAGGWRPAPLYSWRKGRRPCQESPRRHPDPWWPLQISGR